MSYENEDYKAGTKEFDSARFRADLEKDHGISHDHPKAALLFDLCWQEGHAYGLNEVATYYSDFCKLLKT